ncbi:hypothetical protein YDYSY3_43850 [Paenibacillus chitinolyticus]|nr:hypothetical protein YDYSY3_43850 [Paenibacillus chitinolyticus]
MTTAKTYNHGVAWEEAFGLSQGYSVNGTIYISGQFSHDMQGFVDDVIAFDDLYVV